MPCLTGVFIFCRAVTMSDYNTCFFVLSLIIEKIIF